MIKMMIYPVENGDVPVFQVATVQEPEGNSKDQQDDCEARCKNPQWSTSKIRDTYSLNSEFQANPVKGNMFGQNGIQRFHSFSLS